MRTKFSQRLLFSLAALILLPALLIGVLAGCAEKKFTVTVEGGTGGGKYEEGASCTVTATVPEGQVFDYWAENGEEVSDENPYTFTVTRDITLTAVFTAAPAPEGIPAGSEIELNKSVGGNPIGGFGFGDTTFDGTWNPGVEEPWQKGEEPAEDVLTYAGDPAVMVVEENGVETAYLYVGHDVTEDKDTDAYTMPEWLCYSSTDLINWTAEGIILDIEDVPYAANSHDSAWASQVIAYKDHYWFLFCTFTNSTQGTNGAQCVGLAVSKTPVGPFKCYNTPLVYSQWTDTTDLGKSAGDAGWNDIDPTAWVTSEGEFYVAWGNTNAFMCQVEMVQSDGETNGTGFDVELEIVDQSAKANAAGGELPVVTGEPSFYWFDETPTGENAGKTVEEVADIMRIDLYTGNTANNTFTEAPYLYARDLDGDGTIDRYYMFYAAGMREALAYSYIDVDEEGDLWEAHWHYGNRLMDPTATSNTNHPAVFDFGESTYMIYHNGMLPYGLGYRRVACIAELEFSDNGFIDYVAETSTGLSGVTSKITLGGTPIGHMYTSNPHGDAYYPLDLPTFWKEAAAFENEEDTLWEIEAAKYVPEGKNAGAYVSLQAYNMAGLYLCYDITTGEVRITQDEWKLGTPESDALQARMSFRTLKGANGEGVMFQCAADEDYYLAVVDGKLVVTNSATEAQRTFRVQTETGNRTRQYEYNEGVATE